MVGERLAPGSPAVLAREAVGRAHKSGVRGFAASVALVVDQNALAVAPPACERPEEVDRVAEIERAADHNTGDAGQTRRVASQHSVLEEVPVTPLVGDQSSRAQPELGILVAP